MSPGAWARPRCLPAPSSSERSLRTVRSVTTNACLVDHQAIKFLRYTPFLQVGTQSHGVEVSRFGGKVSPFDLTLLCRIHLLPVAVT